MVKEFCSVLEKNKYLFGIYSSKSYLENYFTDEVKNISSLACSLWC